MIDNDKISERQLAAFLVLTMVGIGIFSLPRLVADITGTDGWITTILGGIIVLFDFYIISILGRKFPKLTLVEIAFKTLGRYFAYPVLLIVLIYYITSMAAVLRIFGEVIKMTLLVRTPLEIIMMTLLFVALLLSRCGIEAIARFDEAIFIVLFIITFFGVLIALPGADFTNLFPVFKTDVKVLLYGTLQTAFSYAGFEMVILIFPFIKNPDKIFRSGVPAFIIVILTYLAAVVLSYGYFGIAEAKQLIWPTISLIRSVEVPGSFIERTEGIVMTQWVLFAYTSIVAFLYGAALLVSRATHNREFKHFCTLLTPIVYILAMIPDNVPEVYYILDKSTLYLGSFSVYILPLMLLIVSRFRKTEEGGL